MHTLFFLAPIILLVLVVRLVTLPFRIARRQRWNGGYYGYDRGYNPYRYGCRRHRFGGIGTILALVALDRIFGGRRF